MMERILGQPMPYHMVRKTKTRYYLPSGLLDWDPSATEARYVSHNCRPLQHYRNAPDESSLRPKVFWAIFGRPRLPFLCLYFSMPLDRDHGGQISL
jgi:hypothetical protein